MYIMKFKIKFKMIIDIGNRYWKRIREKITVDGTCSSSRFSAANTEACWACQFINPKNCRRF